MRTRALLFVVLALVAASQWSAAFDGYDSDLWTYRLIVERIVSGHPMWQEDPFLLTPPPTPHVTPYWYALGWIARTLAIPTGTLLRGVGLLAALFCTYAAWRAADALLEPALRAIAVVLFWLTNVGTWPELLLGRNVSAGCALLALASALRSRDQERPSVWVVAWVTLAFYAHPFGGVLAIGAVGLAALASLPSLRWRIPGTAALVLAIAALTVPLGLYTATVAAPAAPSDAHLVRPGVVATLGARALAPGELLRLAPPALLLLLAIGLVARVPARAAVAQRLVRWGCGVAGLVLFTPLYHWASAAFGGWLIERVATLAFPWIGAAVALTAFSSSRPLLSRRVGTAVATLLLIGVAANALLIFSESFVDRPLFAGTWVESVIRPTPRGERRERRPRLFYRFSSEAQQEAASLRPLVAEKVYVSEPLLAYGLAALSLGRPLSVPPGHAAPSVDFMRRARKVDAVLDRGWAPCWDDLFSEFPDLTLLVTPAPGAEMEDRIWSTRKARKSAEAIRDRLRQAGALENAFTGRFFVVDRIRQPAPPAGGAVPTPFGCDGSPG